MSNKVLDAIIDVVRKPTSDPNKKLAKRFGLSLTKDESLTRDGFIKSLNHIDSYLTTVGSPVSNQPNRQRRQDAQKKHLEALLRGEEPGLLMGDRALGEACMASCTNASEAKKIVHQQAREFAKPISDRFCARVEEEITKLEAQEKATHEDYEVGHVRSGVIQKLVDFQKHIRLCSIATRPEDMFGYLD